MSNDSSGKTNYDLSFKLGFKRVWVFTVCINSRTEINSHTLVINKPCLNPINSWNNIFKLLFINGGHKGNIIEKQRSHYSAWQNVKKK